MDPLSLHCPCCGRPIPNGAPESLCPSCLFGAAVEAGPDWIARFDPGDDLGRYRIVRLIGHGGMGEVYEAEDREDGRRVALKVVARHLRRAEDRARFLDEGRAAAALSHPHVVYVFRAEEVAGLPAIAMELLSGGTLKDRVEAEGPLPCREAVDLIRQVLAGIGAIHQAGLLHRDVKPSNCLCDRDGRVKIADFGLSRAPGRHGGVAPFQGTPAFAAPEQLAGESLDARADLYAVAATFFYLLTGTAPFRQRRAPEILTALDAEGPPSACGRQAGIPHALDRLLRRMLARSPGDRLPTADAFALALRPFSSDGWRPARPARRVTAATIDALGLLLAYGPLMVGPVLYLPLGPALSAVLLVPFFAYFTIAEGLCGKTVGMHTVGLRLVTLKGERPTMARAVGRNLLFFSPAVLVAAFWGTTALAATPVSAWVLASVLVASAAVSMIVAARRNHYATLVDLMTDTRVIRLAPGRPPRPVARPVPPARSTALGQIGPYDLTAALGATDHGLLFDGFDPCLHRAVWVHQVDPGTQAVSRREPRPGRLQWLHGERTATGGWDAYECPGGQSLAALPTRQPWAVVRRWLRVLLGELLDAFRSALPRCGRVEEVWIAADGRAIWLDFTPPGVRAAAPAEPLTVASAQRFLQAVALWGLGEESVGHVPLSASTVLARLVEARESGPALVSIARDLVEPVCTSDRVTMGVRAFTVTLSVLALGICTALVRLVGPSAIGSGAGPATACMGLAVLIAAACRGGFWLRLVGVALVTPDGREVSRRRAALRALATWGWLPLQVAAALHGLAALAAAVGLVRVVGFAWAIDHPDCGLPDRVVGTRLVVR